MLMAMEGVSFIEDAWTVQVKSRRRPLRIGSCKSILTPLGGMMFLVDSSFNGRNRIYPINRPGRLLKF